VRAVGENLFSEKLFSKLGCLREVVLEEPFCAKPFYASQPGSCSWGSCSVRRSSANPNAEGATPTLSTRIENRSRRLPVIRVSTLAPVSKRTHSIRDKKTFLMAHCACVVSQFLFAGLVDLKVFSSVDIWSLFLQICKQIHGADSYSKVTWRKSGELDGSMITTETVWFPLLVIYSVPFLV